MISTKQVQFLIREHYNQWNIYQQCCHKDIPRAEQARKTAQMIDSLLAEHGICFAPTLASAFQEERLRA